MSAHLSHNSAIVDSTILFKKFSEFSVCSKRAGLLAPRTARVVRQGFTTTGVFGVGLEGVGVSVVGLTNEAGGFFEHATGRAIGVNLVICPQFSNTILKISIAS